MTTATCTVARLPDPATSTLNGSLENQSTVDMTTEPAATSMNQHQVTRRPVRFGRRAALRCRQVITAALQVTLSF